jgi:hypothetical protein
LVASWQDRAVATRSLRDAFTGWLEIDQAA